MQATLEVERPAADGWEAVVALDTGDVGIWTVRGVDIADDWGGPEVIAADDEAKLHWLAAAELDGRNGTSELLCSGYGGRVVLLRGRSD